jgi:hypothetical protein
MELTLYTSILIVFGFSVLVIVLDEYVVKPWRQKKWERQAASGDGRALDLLKMARSAKVSDE